MQDLSEVAKKKAKTNQSVTFIDTSPKPYLYSPQDTSSLPPAKTKHKHRAKEFHPKELSKADKTNGHSKNEAKHKETASNCASVASKSNTSCDAVTKNSTELKNAADLVVKYLTPAFKEGRIASKVCDEVYFHG